MFETLEQRYQRQLHNWIAQVMQTLYAVQHGKDTYEAKLKALDLIQRQLADAKRATIFLMNRGGK